MRLRRISIRDFKGVAESTVTFEDGVTVVAGPNEVGKSSLAQALDLVLDAKDRSKSAAVRAVKPVHRDAGPEVEVDLEAGPYRFTYRKRFLKKPETELTVTAPGAESHTGDEAHERATAILAESADLALWKALRIDQGTALDLPKIGENASLSKALDAAAGGARADDGALTLFDRARDEFERWFTATGREKKDLADVADRVAALEQEREQVATALAWVERDAERSRAVEDEIRDHERRLHDDEAAAAAAAEELDALKRRQTEVERIEAEGATAGALAAAAERDRLAREAVVAAVAAGESALADAQAAAAKGDPSSTSAANALADATRLLDAARTADAATAKALARRDEDLEFRRAELDHAQMGERLERIVAAEEAARAAEDVLAGSRVDAAALDALREAERGADEARIRAEAGSPEVEISAQREVTVRGGGGDSIVAAGETETRAALDEIVVDAPGVVRVTVRPAGDSAALRDAVREAADRLAALLARHGLDDVAGAEAALAERQEAERAVARREEIVRDNLRDLTRDDIERKVRKLGRRVEGYLDGREAVPGAEEIAPTFDAAQDAVAESRRLRQVAATALEDARREHDVARAAAEQTRVDAESARARVEYAERDLARARDELERARAAEADDTLAVRCAEIATTAAAAAERARAAREELDATQPEAVRLAAEGKAAAVISTRKALRAVQDEALELRTRLAQAGQEGLAERLDAAQTALHHAGRECDSARRRADAARLLFETLSAKRDAARRTYVAPLRERIVRLGKLVFGATFDVELDEELRVTQRTLDGRTVPFEGLSGGAQEQLDILMRAAAAMVVSATGGVPLILDDALGYSDPERLAALGAVLALAGEQCQVIVLTCVPDRYRHVAGATVVRLG